MPYPPLHPKHPAPTPLTMTRAEFAATYPGESAHVEFKTGVGTKTVAETAVALANHEGGVVFFGVRDDGVLTGKQATQGIEDKLHDGMRAVIGSPRYEVTRLSIDGHALPALIVWPLQEGVAQTADGRILVREGSRDVPLMGTRLVTFVTSRATRIHAVERQPSGWSTSEADPALVAGLQEARGWRDWQARGLGDRIGFSVDGRLTVAGALFLRADPESRLGRAYVEILRFPDDTTEDYDLRRTITGALDRQILEATSLTRELVGFEMAFRGSRRVEVPRLPERVVRESIANALAHRSYEQAGACVTIELRPGFVRVRSPGGLPFGVSVEHLREAQSSRNPVILEHLRMLNLAEQRGMGIDVIEDHMQAAMLAAPRFTDLGHAFIVELPLNSAVTVDERAWVMSLVEERRLQPADAALVVYAARGEALTNRRVQDVLGTTERQARQALQRLCATGLLVRHGERSATTYTISREQANRVSEPISRGALQAAVLQLARERERITNADVRAAAGVDRTRALRALDDLVSSGRLERRGEKRGTHYVLRPGAPR